MGGGGGLPGGLVALASKQHGVFTNVQAKAHGLGKMRLCRAAKAGACVRVLPRVYRLGTVEPNFRQRLMAACLWAGPDAVVSHRAAARLYRLDGFDVDLVDLTVPGSPRRPDRVSRLHSGKVSGPDRRTVDGIPVTSVARTLVDIAGRMTVAKVAEPLDAAWRGRQAGLEYVASRLKALRGRGRRGVRTLQRAIADCRRRGKALDSVLEVRTWYRLKRAKLIPPECQLPFVTHDGQRGRIDLAYPRRSVAIECDGREHHGMTKPMFDESERRASMLAALGWRVQRVTAEMLKREPEKLVERIRVSLRTPRVVWTPLPKPRPLGRPR